MALRTLYLWALAVMYQKDILDVKVPVDELVYSPFENKLRTNISIVTNGFRKMGDWSFLLNTIPLTHLSQQPHLLSCLLRVNIFREFLLVQLILWADKFLGFYLVPFFYSIS